MNLIKNLYKLNFTWYSEREKHNYFVEMSQNKKKELSKRIKLHYNEKRKLYISSRHRVFHKIDFTAVLTHKDFPIATELKASQCTLLEK